MSTGAALLDLYDSGKDADGIWERANAIEHAQEIAASLGPGPAHAFEQMVLTEDAFYRLRNAARNHELSAEIDGREFPPAVVFRVERAHREAAEAFRRAMSDIKAHHLPCQRQALSEAVEAVTTQEQA